jgi:hypothetical protein
VTSLDENWKVLKGEINGKPGTVRFNAGLDSLVGSEKYGQELIISVKLKTPNEYGMPSENEADELNKLEDAVRPALQEGLESLLAVIMTTDGFRDFIFYTGNPMSAVKRLQVIQSSFQAMQVDVRGRPDKDWTQYRRFSKVGA